MTLNTRVDLIVPYARKEEAKALGARWDSVRRTWYAPPGTDLQHFDRQWLPAVFGSPAEDEDAPPPAEERPGLAAEKGVSLSELLLRVKGAIDREMDGPVWVRAEISELRGKGGNLYLSLTERDERGDVLANSKGILWKSRAPGVSAKFERTTGEGLRPNIKILCLARIRFDALFGLDLIIEDIDPSYTLGDLAAKLARIREKLEVDGLYARNRGVPAAVEFIRVAVISPESSAGLGDFRRETDRLHGAGLCEFLFFGATFQGPDAPSSIRTAFNEALAAHRRRPIDALVIIRGGGSVTDLAWLNDLELARLACLAPVPVLTGIGHERDSTILDEVAHRRFDTPSKVALHIASTIRDNALATLSALGQIRVEIARALARERTALATQADRLTSGVAAMTREAEDDRRTFMTVIRTAAHYQLREAALALEAGRDRVVERTGQALGDARRELDQVMEAAAQRSQVRLEAQAAALESTALAIALQASAKVEAAANEIQGRQLQVARDAGRLVATAQDDLGEALATVNAEAGSTIELAGGQIETFVKIVVGLGPQATLKRGFAITRDAQGRPVTSVEAASALTDMTVEYHDGRMTVIQADRTKEG